MGQVGNLFSTRTSSLSAFPLSPSRNPWIARGVLVLFAMLAAIVYLPFLQPIFGKAPLNPLDLFFILLLIPAILLLEELRKVLARNLQLLRRISSWL